MDGEDSYLHPLEGPLRERLRSQAEGFGDGVKLLEKLTGMVFNPFSGGSEQVERMRADLRRSYSSLTPEAQGYALDLISAAAGLEGEIGTSVMNRAARKAYADLRDELESVPDYVGRQEVAPIDQGISLGDESEFVPSDLMESGITPNGQRYVLANEPFEAPDVPCVPEQAPDYSTNNEPSAIKPVSFWRPWGLLTAGIIAGIVTLPIFSGGGNISRSLEARAANDSLQPITCHLYRTSSDGEYHVPMSNLESEVGSSFAIDTVVSQQAIAQNYSQPGTPDGSGNYDSGPESREATPPAESSSQDFDRAEPRTLEQTRGDLKRLQGDINDLYREGLPDGTPAREGTYKAAAEVARERGLNLDDMIRTRDQLRDQLRGRKQREPARVEVEETIETPSFMQVVEELNRNYDSSIEVTGGHTDVTVYPTSRTLVSRLGSVPVLGEVVDDVRYGIEAITQRGLVKGVPLATANFVSEIPQMAEAHVAAERDEALRALSALGDSVPEQLRPENPHPAYAGALDPYSSWVHVVDGRGNDVDLFLNPGEDSFSVRAVRTKGKDPITGIEEGRLGLTIARNSNLRGETFEIDGNDGFEITGGNPNRWQFEVLTGREVGEYLTSRGVFNLNEGRFNGDIQSYGTVDDDGQPHLGAIVLNRDTGRGDKTQRVRLYESSNGGEADPLPFDERTPDMDRGIKKGLFYRLFNNHEWFWNKHDIDRDRRALTMFGKLSLWFGAFRLGISGGGSSGGISGPAGGGGQIGGGGGV